jgi:hypothetical protein
MMHAVELDRQASGYTAEIGDMPRHWHLAPKFPTVEPPIPELLPKQVFGRRVGATECSRNPSSFRPHRRGPPPEIIPTFSRGRRCPRSGRMRAYEARERALAFARAFKPRTPSSVAFGDTFSRREKERRACP